MGEGVQIWMCKCGKRWWADADTPPAPLCLRCGRSNSFTSKGIFVPRSKLQEVEEALRGPLSRIEAAIQSDAQMQELPALRGFLLQELGTALIALAPPDHREGTP